MTKIRLRISMSLDGFVAGPQQSLENPLGIGGEQLHEWVFPTRAFQSIHGKEGGIDNESSRVVEEAFTNLGATIMGRNMFGGHPGPWNDANPWKGWWGPNPPYHHPVFVLTHHARAPLQLSATTFTFVTGGIPEALRLAKDAAGAKDIVIAGGAKAAQQYLSAGLVDEMLLHVAPIVLGAGERLFDGVDDLHGLTLARTVAAPDVTHLMFVKR
jgi:dihydrofolate reductase